MVEEGSKIYPPKFFTPNKINAYIDSANENKDLLTILKIIEKNFGKFSRKELMIALKKIIDKRR